MTGVRLSSEAGSLSLSYLFSLSKLSSPLLTLSFFSPVSPFSPFFAVSYLSYLSSLYILYLTSPFYSTSTISPLSPVSRSTFYHPFLRSVSSTAPVNTSSSAHFL